MMLSFRVTTAEGERIRRAAKRARLSVSAYVRARLNLAPTIMQYEPTVSATIGAQLLVTDAGLIQRTLDQPPSMPRWNVAPNPEGAKP